MFDFTDIAPVPPFPDGEPAFVQALKNYDPRKPHWEEMRKIPADSLDLRGRWRTSWEFPDPDGILDSAYDALRRFYDAHVPKTGHGISVRSEMDASFASPEAYTVSISHSGISLRAAGPEGIRRAVYALIDLMRGENLPALPFQSLTRKPWLKHRISRCFFGPIKRAPFFRDELTDEVDYYPEPYLDRLASEGINGLWLTVEWKEIARTSFFPPDPLREKRLEKLRRTVERCRKFGIKIWIFCIEPAAWHPRHPLPPGGEAMRGEGGWREYRSFCVHSDEGYRFIRENSASIFREVPSLGGMMLISLGERLTSCIGIRSACEERRVCQDRCGLSDSQVLNRILSAIRAGIRDAGSDAEIISWLYNPLPQQIPDWWFDLPESLDKENIIAFNFESGISKAQTGRVHVGGDYWLSCTGASDRFCRMAAATANRCDLAAKMQVGCSHELATVPFIPVPGILYQKYRTMHRLGVRHVIQGWYFGNCPGIMNQAAGMLAFEDFSDDEDAFLRRLARIDWGEKQAGILASMWKEFGQAYQNYPLDNQFQYYGPMHDGIVWPLHLKQVLRSLPRSWRPDAFPAGDALGEALVNHTLAEANTLTGLMAEQWHRAVAELPKLRRIYHDDPDRKRDCDLYEALDLLINSGARVLSFYHLRQRLLAGDKSVLPELRRIIAAEIAASSRMTELCRNDPRLGYHSEVETFKFYPAKLQWRIAELQKTACNLAMIEHASPESIRQLLTWTGPIFHPDHVYSAETFEWSAHVTADRIEFTLRFRELPEPFTDEQKYLLLMDRSGLRFPDVINFSREGVREAYVMSTQGIAVHPEGNAVCRIIVPGSKFGYASELFVGVQRTWLDGSRVLHSDNTPAGEYDHDPRLNFNGFSPERLGLLKLDNVDG